jgi:hypothetical protein
VKSKEVKTGCNLAESSKEGYCSKRAVLSVTVVVVMMTICITPSGSTHLANKKSVQELNLHALIENCSSLHKYPEKDIHFSLSRIFI